MPRPISYQFVSVPFFFFRFLPAFVLSCFFLFLLFPAHSTFLPLFSSVEAHALPISYANSLAFALSCCWLFVTVGCRCRLNLIGTACSPVPVRFRKSTCLVVLCFLCTCFLFITKRQLHAPAKESLGYCPKKHAFERCAMLKIGSGNSQPADDRAVNLVMLGENGMVPSEIKLLKILSNHDAVFYIPPYQRNYEWTEE